MATRHSQNDWPAYPDTTRYVRFTAAGQRWWAANDDVAVVFTEFIERFDREVEEITQPTLDDWSYANRLVRGSSTVVSNHGSATAIDLNALKHPRGKHDTFSPAKAKAMRRIKNEITDDSGVPVLRLGLDFTTTVDDMHVEINTGARRVHEAAEKIRTKKKLEGLMAKLDDDDVQRIAAAVWHLQVIELTEAAAKAIGNPDVKAEQLVSAQYLLQWPPLLRRLGREDSARDDANAESDRLRDQGLQRTVDDLALAVGQISRHPTTGGVDVEALATAVAAKLPMSLLASAVADQLAERLQS